MPASRAPRAAPTSGERPYHLGDLRRTLLEEGWAATIESGGKDISLREIARRAGVSPTASFHHFRNKEALLVAVAVEGFARLTATLRKRVESIDDPTERLRIVLRTYIEFAIEHPAVFFRMFGPLLSTPNKYPDLRTAALASFEVLRSAVALHVGGDPDDPNCTTDAWAAWAAMHGAASLIIAGPGSSPDKRLSRATLIDRTVAMVLDGLHHSHR
jgi:AcrR family transcriptional regulator